MEDKDYVITVLAVLLLAATIVAALFGWRLRKELDRDGAAGDVEAAPTQRASVAEPIGGVSPEGPGAGYRPGLVPVGVADARTRQAVGAAVTRGEGVALLKDQEIRKLQSQVAHLTAAAARGEQRYTAALEESRRLQLRQQAASAPATEADDLTESAAPAHTNTTDATVLTRPQQRHPTIPAEDLKAMVAAREIEALRGEVARAQGLAAEAEAALGAERAARHQVVEDNRRLQKDLGGMKGRHRAELEKMLMDLKGIQAEWAGRGGAMERSNRDLAVEATELRAALATERDEAQVMFHEVERLRHLLSALTSEKTIAEGKLARLEEEVRLRPVLTLPSPRAAPSVLAPPAPAGLDAHRTVSPPRTPRLAPPQPPSPLLSPVQQLRLRQLNVNAPLDHAAQKRPRGGDAAKAYKANTLANIDSALGLAPSDPPFPAFQPENVGAAPEGAKGRAGPILKNPLSDW